MTGTALLVWRLFPPFPCRSFLRKKGKLLEKRALEPADSTDDGDAEQRSILRSGTSWSRLPFIAGDSLHRNPAKKSACTACHRRFFFLLFDKGYENNALEGRNNAAGWCFHPAALYR